MPLGNTYENAVSYGFTDPLDTSRFVPYMHLRVNRILFAMFLLLTIEIHLDYVHSAQ